MNKKKFKIDSSSPVSELGKLQPQAIDLEEAVLGALLLEKEALEATISLLTPDVFYKQQNGLVYKAIVSLYKRSQPVDILTVTNELKDTGELEIVGGSYYVSSLTNRIASSVNIEFHARVVLQKFLARELIRVGNETIRRAYSEGEDVFELYAHSIGEMEGALNNVLKYEAKSAKDIFVEFLAESLEAEKSGAPPGVPSHFRPLDKLTNGWQKTDLIILAGRPGMGKTAAVLGIASKPAIESNIPVGIFSLEMSKTQLVGRLAGQLSGINVSRVIKKQLTKEEIIMMDRKCSDIYKAPIYIDDTPALTLLQLKSKARKLVRLYKVQLIVIDYLQLMEGSEDDGNREQEISKISRGLKNLAKELEIPIIALSQLSRQVENRAGGNKRPQLSDLRESGAIEQDADMVMFAYRPEYYEMEQYEIEKETLPTKGLFSLIVAKHRNGALGEVILGFMAEFAELRHWDWDRQAPELTTEERKALDEGTRHTPIHTVSNPYVKPADLQDKKESDTFVQQTKEPDKEAPVNKLENNNEFLSQTGEKNQDMDF